MTNTKPILYVRNLEQAAAMLELDGQISDGFWENATPHNHYQIWCEAEVVVAGPEQECGRTFPARKDNYNLASSELLDVVGKRMLGVVRIARAIGLETARQLEHVVDTDGKVDWTQEYNQKHAVAVAEILRVSSIEAKNQIDAALANESYTMRMLVRDLQDLKGIFKHYVSETVVAPAKWIVTAIAMSRATRRRIGKSRTEIVEPATNVLFQQDGMPLRTAVQIEQAYEAFWNDLNPTSNEIVKVLDVRPLVAGVLPELADDPLANPGATLCDRCHQMLDLHTRRPGNEALYCPDGVTTFYHGRKS